MRGYIVVREVGNFTITPDHSRSLHNAEPTGIYHFVVGTWVKWPQISTDVWLVEKSHFGYFRIINAKVMYVLYEKLLFALLFRKNVPQVHTWIVIT